MKPLISVCVPVYNGELYVEETLNAIYNQTYKNLEILISVDLSTDNTIEICEKYQNKNTKIFIHDTHLGWVKNCNFLIRQSSGTYFSIIPHDDIIPNNYFEKLLEGFSLHPEAVNCFPYIKCFGKAEIKIYQKSIIGPLKDRIFDVINNHYNGVSFRGLVKKNIPVNLLYLREDQPQNMMTDSIWILQHAVAGELYNVDVIYYKRIHSTNEHYKWRNKSLKYKLYAWAYHCATLYNIAFNYIDDEEDLKIACNNRLLYVNRSYHKLLSKIQINLHKEYLLSLKQKYIMKNKNVAVLGGGIQGCCMALLFKKFGYNVTLIDQCNDIMTRASNNQEGKIHLGFVYGMDHSLKTGTKMLNSALHFSHYIEYLIDKQIDWDKLKSQKFKYLVPYDSLNSKDELEKYFNKLQELYEEIITKEPHLSYLGEKPNKLFKQIPVPENLDKDYFKACFETEEVAISQDDLKCYLKEAIANKGINLCTVTIGIYYTFYITQKV